MAETNGGGVGDQAQQAAADAREKGKEKAQEVKSQARSKLREQVDQRSTQVGQQARGAAGDVRTVAEELRRQGRDGPARYAEQAAERVERAGGWLEDSDGDRILRDVEDFGRRNPWAIVAGGLALGLVASRLLKASSRERYHATLPESSTLPHDATATRRVVPAAPPREPVGTPGI